MFTELLVVLLFFKHNALGLVQVARVPEEKGVQIFTAALFGQLPGD